MRHGTTGSLGLPALMILLAQTSACAPDPTGTTTPPRTSAPVAHALQNVRASSGMTAIDLGRLPGGTHSVARAINNDGTITGYSDDAHQDTHLVRWKRGGSIEDLGQIAGLPTVGQAIDDFGDIVGTFGTEPNKYPTVGENDRAFYWSEGTGFVVLPSSVVSLAWGVARINNSTILIVGCDASTGAQWISSSAGFLLSHTSPIPYTSFDNCVHAVSPSGRIVGNFGVHAYTRTQQGNRPWGRLKGLVNGENNEVWGVSDTPLSMVGWSGAWAVMWPGQHSDPIRLAPSQYNSGNAQAQGVNNIVEVVGQLDVGRPFYWTSDVGLQELSPLSGFLAARTWAINDSAEVVGQSYSALSQLDPYSATLWLPRDVFPITVVQLPPGPVHLPPKVSYKPKRFINDGILSRPGFDATQLDPNLITLGDGVGHVTAIARTASGGPMASFVDVNRDGVLDLQVSFSKAQLITDGVLTPTSFQFEIAFIDVTGLPTKAHYPIWVQ